MVYKILKNSTWLLLFRIFGTGFTFAITVFLARIISVDMLGQYGALINYANYIALILGLGLPISYIYFCQHDEFRQKDLILSSIIFYILIYFCVYLITKLFFLDTDWLGFFLTFTCCLSIFSCVLAVHNQLENFRIFGFYHFLLPCLTITALLALPFIDGLDISLRILFFVHAAVIVTLLLVIISELKIKKLWTFKPKLNLLSREYYTYGIKGVSSDIMGMGLYTLDIAILAYFVEDAQLAYYIIAGTLVKIAWFVSDALAIIIFPKVVKSKNKNTHLIKALSSYSFLINMIGLIVFFFIGEALIGIVFGAEYKSAYVPTLLLLMGSHGITIYKLLGQYFAAHNKWSALYMSLGAALILNVILNIILIPSYGIHGAAFASLVAYWLCGISMVLLSADKDFIGYICKFKITDELIRE